MPVPVHQPTVEEDLERQIRDDLAIIKAAREQDDDLKAALTEAHMNELLEALAELKEAS